MSQNLPVNNFECVKNTSQFHEDFIKNVVKKVMKNILLKLMLSILNIYIIFIVNYQFYQKEWNEKLVANLHDKTEYVIHIRKLNQTLNHGLCLKKLHRIIKFNLRAWLKSYIDMNNDLKKKSKKWFWKKNLSWWIMQFL